MFRQTWIVTVLGFRSIRSRIKSSLVIVAGLTSVVGVLLAILSLGEGIERSYLAVGDPNRAVVHAVGSQRDIDSKLLADWVNAISGAPGIQKWGDGAPLADPEIYVPVAPLKKTNQKGGYTYVRGIGQKGFAMRPELKLVSGRMLRQRQRELMVGIAAQEKFAGLALGDVVPLANGAWTIVGVFATGNFDDGGLLADVETLKTELNRETYNTVTVQLDAPDSFTAFKVALSDNRGLMVERETEYWQRRWDSLPQTPRYFAYVLSFIIAMGALSATIHTMYAAIGARAEEIAILRAVGFGGTAVAASVVIEAMLLACLGAMLGTGITWLLLDGYTYNGAYGVFRAAVTPHLLAVGIGWALAVGLAGALLPAIHAARLTVIGALRVI